MGHMSDGHSGPPPFSLLSSPWSLGTGSRPSESPVGQMPVLTEGTASAHLGKSCFWDSALSLPPSPPHSTAWAGGRRQPQTQSWKQGNSGTARDPEPRPQAHSCSPSDMPAPLQASQALL